MTELPGGEIIVYEAPGGEVRVDVRLERETVWLSQEQIAELFGRERSVVTKHIRNVFKEGELDQKSNVHFLHIAGSDKPVGFYNLDVIISIGYRVNSKRGTQFRIWATRTLREHLIRGYTLDRQRFARNAAELEAALTLVRKAAAGEALTTDQGRGLVDVIARYTQTFLLLQRYDEGLLAEPKGNPGGVLPAVDEACAAIARLKVDLLARGEATDLFGREREDGLAALLGNLDQSVFGEPAYPTVESKAASHLLRHQEPSVLRRQQAHRLFPVRGLPAPQWSAVPKRRGGGQRCGTRGACAARCRVGAERQGSDDPAGDEHAHGAAGVKAQTRSDCPWPSFVQLYALFTYREQRRNLNEPLVSSGVQRPTQTPRFGTLNIHASGTATAAAIIDIMKAFRYPPMAAWRWISSLSLVRLRASSLARFSARPV